MINPIRWKQRFENFDKAFVFLTEGVGKSNYNKLEEAGVIQAFEFTFELAWNTLKDYLELMGITATSPKEIIKQAFQAGYIVNGQAWLEALDNRNQIVDKLLSSEPLSAISYIRSSYPLIQDLHSFFKTRL